MSKNKSGRQLRLTPAIGVRGAGIAGLLIVLAAPDVAGAQSRWSLGADVGTAGIGAELAFMLSPRFTIRGTFNNLEYNGDIKGDVLTYKGHLRLNTGGLFLDWHPWANGWMATGGAYMGARDAGGGPQLQSVNTIGGQTFTFAQVRGINADVKLDRFAPTLGVGWNNTFYHRHLGLKALAGVVFSNQPKVTLSTLSGANLPPDVQARLEAAIQAEQERIASHTDILKTYPLLQVGVNYRF